MLCMNVLYPIEVSVAFKYYYYYSVLFGNGAMIEAKKCWLMSAKLPGGGGGRCTGHFTLPRWGQTHMNQSMNTYC